MEMAAPTKVILLACGSFNPVTNMHLRMFELARDMLNRSGHYRVVGGIISPVADSYSKQELASANDRCAMLKLALQSSDWISVDTWESEQSTWHETIKVLRHHHDKLQQAAPHASQRKRKHNSQSNDEVDSVRNSNQINNMTGGPPQLKLLCGGDLLESFGRPGLWKGADIEEIVSRFGLVCVSRSGFMPEKFIYDSDVLTKYKHNIYIVTEWIPNEISSTKIRRALRRAESVKYLLQDIVIDYIHSHNLYGAGDNKYLDLTLPSPISKPFVEPPPPSRPHRNSSSPRSFNRRRPHHPAYDEEYRLLHRDYRTDDSFDSIDSVPRSPRRPGKDRASGETAVCGKEAGTGDNVSGGNSSAMVITRRMNTLRMHGVTPETCV